MAVVVSWAGTLLKWLDFCVCVYVHVLLWLEMLTVEQLLLLMEAVCSPVTFFILLASPPASLHALIREVAITDFSCRRQFELGAV